MEKRIAPDEEAYTMDEFKEFYGDDTEWYWNEAKTFEKVGLSPSLRLLTDCVLPSCCRFPVKVSP